MGLPPTYWFLLKMVYPIYIPAWRLTGHPGRSCPKMPYAVLCPTSDSVALLTPNSFFGEVQAVFAQRGVDLAFVK